MVSGTYLIFVGGDTKTRFSGALIRTW
jgi:hypothetical protein